MHSLDRPVSQEPIVPVAIQHPIFQQHVAARANSVNKSPASGAANQQSNSNSQKQNGVSSGGGGPGPIDELHPDYIRAKNRLEAAQSTLHQLSDLIDGVYQGVSTSGYGPASAKNNQRLIKSAVSAATEIVSHSQADGEKLFRIQYANLYSKTLPTHSQRAVAAYGKSAEYSSPTNRDPSLIRQSMNVVTLHITGPNGILADLQNISDNGPHTTERAKRSLNEARTTLLSLQNVISDTQVKLAQQATMTGTARSNGPLNKFL
ncbi:MAG: hypothetical protein ACKVQS_02525 [Fimbriimonadaceae bacterium]